jgi:hypothetical protein
MKQRSFAPLSSESEKKPTRRKRFVGAMEKVLPRQALLALTEPRDPTSDRGGFLWRLETNMDGSYRRCTAPRTKDLTATASVCPRGFHSPSGAGLHIMSRCAPVSWCKRSAPHNRQRSGSRNRCHRYSRSTSASTRVAPSLALDRMVAHLGRRPLVNRIHEY